MFIFSNLALANRNLPAIIWCFVSRTRLASSRIDVSVQQSDTAPSSSWLRLHSNSSRVKPSTECRGAVSVGAVSSARGDASKKFFGPFEGVSGGSSRRVLAAETNKAGQNRQTAEE